MSLVTDLKKRESTLRELQEEKAKFMGQLEQLKSDVKAKFNISSIDAAEKLYTEKKTKRDALTIEGDALLLKITTAIEKAKAKNAIK